MMFPPVTEMDTSLDLWPPPMPAPDLPPLAVIVPPETEIVRFVVATEPPMPAPLFLPVSHVAMISPPEISTLNDDPYCPQPMAAA